MENENSRTATMTIDEPPTPFNFEYCEDEDEGKYSCSDCHRIFGLSPCLNLQSQKKMK